MVLKSSIFWDFKANAAGESEPFRRNISPPSSGFKNKHAAGRKQSPDVDRLSPGYRASHFARQNPSQEKMPYTSFIIM
jgi:hypothetical protein